MTEETDVGTAETQPADDLRSALAAAFTESETSAAEPVETTAKPVASETTEPKEPRERTPDGKFAKKSDTETDAEPTEATAAAEPKEGEEAAAPEATEPPKEEDKHEGFIKTWKAADREMFKKLAPDAQEFLSRRYKEMDTDYNKKVQANARLRTEYEPIDKMFEPHRGKMKELGFTPESLIKAWSSVEEKLNGSPEDAAGIIAGLVRGYNVPGPVLAKALGIAPPARQVAQQTNGAAPDNPQAAQTQQNGVAPEFADKVSRLEQAYNALTAERQQEAMLAQQSKREKAQQDIDSFRGEKDKEGTLLRPHYDDVEQDMLMLANLAISAKQPVPSLSTLYEKAVWLNPAVREAVLTAQKQAEESKRTAQDKAKAAAARKASASVTGAPGSGQATASRAAPERTLREELESNMAENA